MCASGFLGGPVAQLGFLQVEELKERQAHSPKFGKPDGPRFESGRAHHIFQVELASFRALLLPAGALALARSHPTFLATTGFLEGNFRIPIENPEAILC